MRGYHAYKDIWTAVVGEELPCQREVGNRVDVFAVAVMRGETVVGHVPKKISSVCSLYLRRDGSIVCRVTGSRRYSEDLAQGGLEIPCVLIFEGDAKLTAKAQELVESALATTAAYLPASKKRKLDDSPVILFKISQFLFSRSQAARENREILHHAKISRYTVNTSRTHIRVHILSKQMRYDSGPLIHFPV